MKMFENDLVKNFDAMNGIDYRMMMRMLNLIVVELVVVVHNWYNYP
jgi:hypothetical protein